MSNLQKAIKSGIVISHFFDEDGYTCVKFADGEIKAFTSNSELETALEVGLKFLEMRDCLGRIEKVFGGDKC